MQLPERQLERNRDQVDPREKNLKKKSDICISLA